MNMKKFFGILALLLGVAAVASAVAVYVSRMTDGRSTKYLDAPVVEDE